MKIIYKYFLIIIPFFSFSQENLTLENALKIGLKQNFDIQLSKKNLEVSKLNNNLANAGALPTLNISTRQEQAVSDQSKNPTSFIQEILKSESINASANLSWTLLDGYRIKASKERLNQLEYLSNGNLTLTIENTSQAIILSYYNCILQKHRLELLQKVVKLSRERVIYQKTKYDIGVSSKMEFLQFKNTLLTDSSNLLIQKQNLNNAIKNLNLVMGVDLTSDWVFTDKMNSEIQVFNLNNLKDKTLENNINILNQSINNEIIKQEITIAKSAYYPHISFNSGASYNESTYDVGNSGFTGDNTGETLNYYTNLSINFRLYDGGKYRTLLQESEIRKDINNLNLEKLKRNVLNKLLINYEKYNNSIVIYNLNKNAFEIAELNYQLANDKNNRGIINSFNLRDIEIAYLNSGLSYLQSLYSLNESYLELVKITGGIIDTN
tara:strand:+ start:9751 stop:11064 length:1314 start_codon:yes stop_codon:yes gene_type:complete